MTLDAVELDRDLRQRGEKRSLDWFAWLALAALVAFSVWMYLWEYANQSSDLYKHALIASEFSFTDLHSITSRLAYPLWHLFVAAFYQLGVPLAWAAAGVCALCKAAAFLLTRRYLVVMTRARVSDALLTVLALLVMVVTPIRVLGVNDGVYHGVGSPTVWHNPTQLAVLVTALLCVPYTLHCWYAFEARAAKEGPGAMLPWRKVITLAALLMLSLSAKPTFMQALIPAAAMFFLIQWIRRPHSSRFFLQMIAAFLPAVAYFILQYLYYTGVVVPYTSGVEFALSWQSAWEALRNMLLMAAFPLFALAFCRLPERRRDQTVILCLWMAFFSILEAMSFQETGIRIGHGNFNWASMSSAFLLWVVVLPRFIEAVAAYRTDAAALRAETAVGTAASTTLRARRTALRLRSAAFLGAFVLLVWHAYSSVYYLMYLLQSGNVF